MIGLLRFVIRLLAAIFCCLGMWIYGHGVRFRHRRNPRNSYHAMSRTMSKWGYALAWIFGMKIRITGTPPKAPFFLVTNHQSYTDIFLLCATCPGWFISKAEVARWPGIGPLTRVANTLFIDRETRRDVHRMNQLIADLVRDGGGVGFFPEGTTTDGTSVIPFKPSLLQPAIEHKIPVHVAAIVYETLPGYPPPEEQIAWYGVGANLLSNAYKVFQMPSFTAHVHFDEQTYTAEDRKTLARITHAAVSGLHTALRNQTRHAPNPA